MWSGFGCVSNADGCWVVAIGGALQCRVQPIPQTFRFRQRQRHHRVEVVDRPQKTMLDSLVACISSHTWIEAIWSRPGSGSSRIQVTPKSESSDRQPSAAAEAAGPRPQRGTQIC